MRVLLPMTCTASRYADWKAPARDGEVLIWPDGPLLLQQTLENQRALDSAQGVRLQGVALAELRREERRWIGHEAGRPLVASGHQTELYHPGVWVKDALANAAAERIGGVACHFAVDTDAPKHLHLRWPGASHPISDDPDLNTAAWAGLLESASPAHVEMLRRELAEASAGWGYQPAADSFLAAFKTMGLESANLAWTLTNAMHHLDWELGLRHQALLASPLWSSPAYGVFVHHLLARAGKFSACYNAVLAEYRREQGIRTAGRPWPDLRCESAGCEAPFWFDNIETGQRTRGFVHRVGDRMALRAGEDEFELDPLAEGWAAGKRLGEFLRAHHLRLSPRALTLTVFLRLAVVDQFVHGIGGGRYDQVTDCVIRRFFGMEPPAFSVATATLYFPTADQRPRINLAPLVQEGRRLRHGSLSPRKMGLVREIESLPRNSQQRREKFFAMHAQLAAAMEEPQFKNWQRRLQEAQALRDEQQPLLDREYFYGIQPMGRLRGLIERCREAVGL